MPFSPNDKHIIVNYHYVDDPRPDRGGFHPCPIEEFEKQIAFLSNEYTVTTVADVFRTTQSGKKEKVCALTFDDGLKDNFINAIPVLKKYDARATFFPITKTTEGFLPTTHKMHFLLSHESAEKITDRYNAFLEDVFPHMVEAFSISKTERLTRIRKLYDDVITANVKETMNRVPSAVRNLFLKTLFKELELNEKEMARSLFMAPEELKTLRETKHAIGCHGHSHEALDSLEEVMIREDISSARKTLRNILGEITEIFAYPQSAPSGRLHDILEDEGFSYALTTERRGVARGDDPFLIPRFDTNDIRDFLERH